MKKKEKWYDRYILTLKTLYHRFSENKNIILIVFIINVFVWVIVNINIIEYGNLSSEYLWKYPYNYVCMSEEKYTEEEFQEKARKYTHAAPFTKESLLYREIFEKYYPGQGEMIVDFWMPNRDWEGCQVDDPSARVLANYGDSGK